jgi:ABC-type transporter Mla MlaB component
LIVGLDFVSGRLTLVGPLGRDTIHRFRDAMATMLVCDCPRWTVDVSRLTACDRAGLHSLVGACRWAARRDRRVVLVGAPLWLQRELIKPRRNHRHVHNGPGTVAAADLVTTGADLERHLPRPPGDPSDPGASGDRDKPAEVSAQVPLFTATVNGKRGTIGIRGHLDRVGADLLCGSVVEASAVLAALARRLCAKGVELAIP